MTATASRWTGSIPAHAGEPLGDRLGHGVHEVYPRPRGGARAPAVAPPGGRGLSPPTRGSLQPAYDLLPFSRSIPAHAGEPAGPFRDGRFSGVYPRPRGGARASRNAHAPILGLSPPTRGSPHEDDQGQALGGSIPAHAGGANDGFRYELDPVGLSPPTRGSRLRVGRGRAGVGSIPAHAGEPPSSSSGISIPRVYPRPRGGAAVAYRVAFSSAGLSPPTRGSPHPWISASWWARSIPAHAGEPFSPPDREGVRWVYPRPRGGATWR